MKRFALITLYCSLASLLMCADIFAQAERQDDKGVRQDSDRGMTEGRHKRIPNAQQKAKACHKAMLRLMFG